MKTPQVAQPVPLAANPRAPRPASPLGDVPGAFVNLSHRIRFAQAGYLASMDAELQGVPGLPATRDLLAAFHPVIFHDLAKRAGIPVAPMRVVEDESELTAPCRLLPAHPWMWSGSDAKTLVGAKRAFKSVSMGGNLPVALFETPGQPFSARSFFGMTTAAGREDLAWSVWRTFHVPLVRIHGHTHDDRVEITHLEPLKLRQLSERDLRLFTEVSERPFSDVSWMQ